MGDAVATAALGAIEGAVGLLDQGRDAPDLGAGGRDAEADGHRLEEPAKAGDRLADPAGDLQGGRGVGAGQEDREFLAAVAGRQVVLADVLAEQVGDGAGPRRRRGGRRCRYRP